jgi:CoA:oxalate CoA-transferase
MNGSQGLPLAGIRVIDWTHVLAGPYASYNLALLGADVIRVERVDGADFIRTQSLDPAHTAQELGDAFVMQNAGKRSIAIDVTQPAGKNAMAKLIASADVLVENFRPGKLRKLGFDPLALRQLHPRLIICSVTGYGQSGARSTRRAYDHAMQAASGLMAANADADGLPQRIGFPIVDYTVGLQASQAVLAALLRQPRGEWLDVSMHATALTLLAPTYASFAATGKIKPKSRSTAFSGSALSGTFQTANGHLALVCNNQAQADALAQALRALPVAATTVAELVVAAQQVDVERCQQLLQAVFAQRDAAFWEEFLEAAQVPAACVATPIQAFEAAASDHKRWPRVVLPHATGGRTVSVPGIGYGSQRMVDTPVCPPLRGQHSRVVLQQIGMSDEQINQLQASGIIHDHTATQTQ